MSDNGNKVSRIQTTIRSRLFSQLVLSLARYATVTIALVVSAANGRSMLDSANTFYSEGKLKESIALYKKASQAGDNPVLCNFNSANAWFQLDSFPKAVVYYRLCIADAPGFIKAYLNLAVTYYTLDDMGQCIATALRGLKLDASHPKLNLLLAVAYRKTGAYAEAIIQFEKIATKFPSMEDPYIALGEMYRDLDDTKEAIRWLNAYPQTGQNHTYVDQLLADIYESDNDYVRAAYCLRQAFSSDTTNKWILYRIARLQEKQGNDLVALETARHGMDLFPGFPEMALFAGNISFRYGRFSEAEYCYNKAYLLGNADALIGLQNIHIKRINKEQDRLQSQ